jgi:hypothetical protein
MKQSPLPTAPTNLAGPPDAAHSKLSATVEEFIALLFRECAKIRQYSFTSWRLCRVCLGVGGSQLIGPCHYPLPSLPLLFRFRTLSSCTLCSKCTCVTNSKTGGFPLFRYTYCYCENVALGIEKDKAAVVAALTHNWSNGQVEGQVNRLKLRKRQLYGRASFDLLGHYVLDAP